MSEDSFGFEPDDVKEDLSIIERTVDKASSSDEYLDAILRANIAQLRVKGENDMETMKTVNGIPDGTAGMAAEDIPQRGNGYVVFHVDGRSVVKIMQSETEVEAKEVVAVDYDQGGVRPISGVDQSFLNIGAIQLDDAGSSGFKIIESESDVTIQPGETKTILDASVSKKSALWQIGSASRDYSGYYYKIDGSDVLSEDGLSHPLGLFNDMYEFPRPLSLQSGVEVIVKRSSAANGPAEYWSKIAVTEA